MTDHADLVRGLEIQAAGCAAFGSPFSAALLNHVALDIAADGPAVGLFAPWRDATARALIEGAVPLRLLGALHDLVLSGAVPDLAAHYPGTYGPGDSDAAWRTARSVIVDEETRLAAFMTHEPQTNEVRRAACLLPGFLAVSRETGLPLRCFELGASAGLNQNWDHFRYRFGAAGEWGDSGSAVGIDAEWRGGTAPPVNDVSVLSRAACDRKPVDLADPIARRRLRSYVWADQHDRLDRLDAAIALARAAGTTVEAEDAVTWTERRAAPSVGAATVLYHSVFWQYMPSESQTALTKAIRAHGAAATPSAPFAWLRMEPDPVNLAHMELSLTLWPNGADRRLARVHPHGAWVEWL